MDKYKYKTSFSFHVRPVVSKDRDQLLALASLDTLKKYIPNVNAEKNTDLLPIAFNACVANRFNLNDDGVDGATAVAMADQFVNKPIDIEHNRSHVVGVILNVAFTEFGTDKPLTKEECMASTEPFNITLGGVVWRAVSNEVANVIEECADPTSANYLKISASWELGFTEYDLALIEGEGRNISNATRISDPLEVAKLEGKLRSNGGNGRIDSQRVYRLVKGDVLPMGIGLTENPAADVVGVAIQTTEIQDDSEALSKRIMEDVESAKDLNSLLNKVEKRCKDMGMNDADIESMKERVLEHCKKMRPELIANTTTDLITKIEEVDKKLETSVQTLTSNIQNSSLLQKDAVKIDSEQSMKITSIKEITDSNLKEISASAITDFVETELKKASEQYSVLKTEKEQAIKVASEKYETLVAESNQIKQQLQQLKTELEKLQTEKNEREQVEQFNLRMASLDEVYDLTADDRKVLASQIKDLSDEQFNAFKDTIAVLMKEKSKEFKKTQASANSQTIVDDALENGKKKGTEVPNTTDTAKQTISDRMKKAFAKDQLTVQFFRR